MFVRVKSYQGDGYVCICTRLGSGASQIRTTNPALLLMLLIVLDARVLARRERTKGLNFVLQKWAKYMAVPLQSKRGIVISIPAKEKCINSQDSWTKVGYLKINRKYKVRDTS